MHDRLRDGQKIRLLTIVDTFTRECVAREVEPRGALQNRTPVGSLKPHASG